MASDAAFSEALVVTDDRPIRQGDVFEWLENTKDPWRRLGVVVTADCDIAQEKHRGVISYVPVLSVADYLMLAYLPKRVERGTRALVPELAALLRRIQAQNLPAFPDPLSDAAAEAWVLRSAPKEIAAELGLAGKDAEKFFELANLRRDLATAVEESNFDKLADVLIRIRARSTSADKAREAFWTEVDAYFKDLPGDAFFIGSVSDEQRAGYVAYLRMVREIRQPEIAIRFSETRGETVRARRVARLTPPYVYRLTQQLGDVFAAIGLPTEYEKRRGECIASLAPPTRP